MPCPGRAAHWPGRFWLGELPEPVQHAAEDFRGRRDIGLAGQLWFFQAHVIEQGELQGPVIPGAGPAAS